MFCKECGENNRNDRKFCTNCGAPLRDYTKPRENLIMPEEIKTKQSQVANYNKNERILKIVSTVALLLSIIFLIASFVTDKTIQLTFIISSLIMITIFIICLVIKMLIIKKRKQINKNANNEKK